jgi:hypothetical protein
MLEPEALLTFYYLLLLFVNALFVILNGVNCKSLKRKRNKYLLKTQILRSSG